MPEFAYEDLLPLGEDGASYRLLTTEGVRTVEGPGGRPFLEIDREALRLLTDTAMHDIAHYLRPAHLAQLRSILDDDQASSNDKFVALDLLKNANIAAAGVLPMCQDTGTAIVMGKKGLRCSWVTVSHRTRSPSPAGCSTPTRDSTCATHRWPGQHVGGAEHRFQPAGADRAVCRHRTRARELLQVPVHGQGRREREQVLPLSGDEGDSEPDAMLAFLDEKLRSLGTAACPPYHLAIVVGGTSAEFALKTAKYASAKYLDALPKEGDARTAHGFRDRELEQQVLELTRQLGLGAQFGGKYFCHDVRVVRLPRHGASLPVAIAVSCSADRQCLGRITPDGVFIEELERDPARFLPDTTHTALGGGSAADDDVVRIDLRQPMADILAELTKHPVKTSLALTGPLVVARDIAHAKIKQRLDAGEDMPHYLKEHAIYYAGPAKTPDGYASGSFGPTTAGRMDTYVDQFQAAGGSKVMLAKGNRSAQVRDACATHGGFYLGSIGGPAARLAKDCITSVEVLEYEELGMEAVWKIEVEDFPAFIVTDDKGNDFFTATAKPTAFTIPKRAGL